MLGRAPQSMKMVKRFPSREERGPSGPWGGLWIREPTPSLCATPPRRGFSWEVWINRCLICIRLC